MVKLQMDFFHAVTGWNINILNSIQKIKYKPQETAKKWVSIALSRIVLKQIQVAAQSATSHESTL